MNFAGARGPLVAPRDMLHAHDTPPPSKRPLWHEVLLAIAPALATALVHEAATLLDRALDRRAKREDNADHD